MESLLDLGMSLPSTAGHTNHKMPPKHGHTCGFEGALLIGSWSLPAASAKIKCDHYKMLTFATPLKGVQGGDKNKALCALVKTQKNRPSDSQLFSGKDFYESKFLHLLIPREILMSWTNVWTWFAWLAPPAVFLLSLIIGPVSLTSLLSLFLQVVLRQEYPLANTRQRWNKLPYHPVDSHLPP